MTNTEKYFVECVKRGIKDEKVDFVPEGLDYQHLYNLCKSHSMSVVVFRATEHLKEQLNNRFYTAVQRSAHRHIVWDVQSAYDVNTVLTAFEERGIRHMPLKGYHLKKLYPMTDMRYSSDCDILIDVKQIKEIRALVKELGLSVNRYDEHHDIVYYPETKTVFELHKTVFVGNLEKSFGMGLERASIKEGYQYMYEMTPEAFYLSILGHSAYHFSKAAGVGIRHLTDVYLYRKKYALDEKALQKELEKCKLVAFKEAFEKLAYYFFEDGEADALTLKLAKHVLESSLLENKEKKLASDVASNIKTQEEDKTKTKKRTLLRTFFPEKEKLCFTYPILKKAIWLLPIFYVVRWVEVVFTRPQNIKKLKGIHSVNENDFRYMKELRDSLGINHL